jgi:hypothetical protein
MPASRVAFRQIRLRLLRWGVAPFGPMNTRPFGPDSAKHWKCLLTIGAMTDGSATVPDRLHSWGAGDETPAGNLRS